LTDSEVRLREATSKKIFLEVALLKAIQAREAVQIDSVLKQLQQLRSEATGFQPASAPRAATKAAESAATSAAQVATPQPAPASAGSDLPALWQNVLEAVGRVSAFTRSYLVEAHPVSLVKNVFTIGFDPEFRDRLDLVN